jgi:hypothetical protein
MSVVIGLDPGVNTGFALIEDQKIEILHTINPLDVLGFLSFHKPDRVVFEDSRLTSFLFTSNAKLAVAKNMARKVGQVDMVCSLIVTACDRLGIPAHGISPKGKGAKLNAAQFKAATGWAGKSNEHERDACMVAWPYRGAK